MKNQNEKKERPPLNTVMREAAVNAGVLTAENTLRPYVLSSGSATLFSGRPPLVDVGPILKLDYAGIGAAISHMKDKDHNPNAPFQTNVPQWLLDLS